ncbi:hypothetical protein BGZ65_004261 [Modicella reniformis]|uniref:Uncharacterized protein n=1 Tax=Modicella reniformis TaxID=1440133 RepID=A0A9P6MB88_9FUNG|nr:hypothetical protein BGZ65_004261 [Modicella reniformis]
MTPLFATGWLSMTVQTPAYPCHQDEFKVHMSSLWEGEPIDLLWDPASTDPQDVDETFVQGLKEGDRYQVRGHMQVWAPAPTSLPSTSTYYSKKHGNRHHQAELQHQHQHQNQQPLKIILKVIALKPASLRPPLRPPIRNTPSIPIKRSAQSNEPGYDVLARAMQTLSAAEELESEIKARGLADGWTTIVRAIKRPRLSQQVQESGEDQLVPPATCLVNHGGKQEVNGSIQNRALKDNEKENGVEADGDEKVDGEKVEEKSNDAGGGQGDNDEKVQVAGVDDGVGDDVDNDVDEESDEDSDEDSGEYSDECSDKYSDEDSDEDSDDDRDNNNGNHNDTCHQEEEIDGYNGDGESEDDNDKDKGDNDKDKGDNDKTTDIDNGDNDKTTDIDNGDNDRITDTDKGNESSCSTSSTLVSSPSSLFTAHMWDYPS